MVLRIESPEDYERVRHELEPVYLESKTGGRVAVPCVRTVLVRRELVVANAYNPNAVSPDKMELLRQSILDNGFCFPVVAIWDADAGRAVIIDGFHRTTIAGADWLDLDFVPVVFLGHDMTRRMAATMQFNRARGVHQVDLDADVVRALVEQGISDEEIAVKLGMEVDAVHRYKQVTGVAELFKGSDYSMAWEMVDDE
jgi:ParB-like chromosome segregation protein Spo0J